MLPIWGFVAVTLPLVATPGASTAVVLRNSITGGARAGLWTALGCNTGSVSYGVLSAFGFGLALQRWPSVWLLLRMAGVAYLGWLGVMSLRHALHPQASQRHVARDVDPSDWRSATSGFLTNVLNPSIAAFYLIVLPQFVPRDLPFTRSALTLTAIHVGMAFTWHGVWALAGATLARLLTSGAPRRTLDAVTGLALIWLALKVAL